MSIFTWSYVIPLTFIVYFYSQLLQSIRNHERMLREQVGVYEFLFPLLLLPFFSLLFLISSNDPAVTDFLRFCSTGKEDERKVISLESGQGKERGTENRQSGIYDIFPLPFGLDTVRNRGHDRSIWQSVISTFLRKLFPVLSLFLLSFFLFVLL